ncbi:MAG: regulatory iron-sulfur-containing complex subunit RicT [Gemmatimonadaceae bacterium]
MTSHLQLIEIAFKGNRKEFFLWDGEEAPAIKSPVIVDADRGEDFGHVHSTGELARKRNAKVAHGLGGNDPTQKARRLATDADIRQYTTARTDDDDARKRAIERVRANSLVMKVTDAEWQWDRKKLTLYFTAEKRVDFRTLVRELASMFRTRIELKQIGVRDEAKRLDGYGRCGRQYCSASWLPELRPVNLGVAKDQKLSLNPSQISGACGRLMCCLRYEHEFYVTTRRRFPKEGKAIRTSKGEERVMSNDLFRERVTLRAEEGESRIVTLAELREELAALGLPFPTPSGPAPQAHPVAASDDELPAEDDVLEPAELVAVSEPDELLIAGTAAAPSATEGESDSEQSEHRRPRRRGRRGGRRGRHGPDTPGSDPQAPPSTPNG